MKADAPGVSLLALPHLDVGRGRARIDVPVGTTLAEMVGVALPGADPARVRVTIGEHVVAPDIWHRVRPRHGAVVIIRVVPAGDNLRTVLSIAVVVAAMALGQFYAPALAGSIAGAVGATSVGGAALVSAATVQLVQAGITLAATVAGTLLINALVPVRGLGNQDKGPDIYSITGLQNSADPGGVIPSVLGRHRYAPRYAATPFTEVIGNDQYVTAAFLFG